MKPIDTTHALLEAAAELLEAHGWAWGAKRIRRKMEIVPDMPLSEKTNAAPQVNFQSDNDPSSNELAEYLAAGGAAGVLKRKNLELRDATIEECAKVLDAIANDGLWEAGECAEAIRALKGKAK
jgi:hypothetical protein